MNYLKLILTVIALELGAIIFDRCLTGQVEASKAQDVNIQQIGGRWIQPGPLNVRIETGERPSP